MDPNPIIIILMIVLVETIAMTCLKKYELTKDFNFFIYGIVAYIIVCMLLCQSFKYENLALTNMLWSSLSILATTTVGVMYFKDVLHLHDYIAISLIVTGLTILKSTK